MTLLDIFEKAWDPPVSAVMLGSPQARAPVRRPLGSPPANWTPPGDIAPVADPCAFHSNCKAARSATRTESTLDEDPGYTFCFCTGCLAIFRYHQDCWGALTGSTRELEDASSQKQRQIMGISKLRIKIGCPGNAICRGRLVEVPSATSMGDCGAKIFDDDMRRDAGASRPETPVDVFLPSEMTFISPFDATEVRCDAQGDEIQATEATEVPASSGVAPLESENENDTPSDRNLDEAREPSPPQTRFDDQVQVASIQPRPKSPPTQKTRALINNVRIALRQVNMREGKKPRSAGWVDTSSRQYRPGVETQFRREAFARRRLHKWLKQQREEQEFREGQLAYGRDEPAAGDPTPEELRDVERLLSIIERP
jgi:hypothetical protein